MAQGFSVLLLASTDPRRLKTPRALLPFGDTSILGRTLQAYIGLKPKEIIVVSADSAERIEESIGKAVESINLISVPDARGKVGLGIKLGLERLESEPQVLMIGLGDQPLLTKELLQSLLKKFEEGKGTIGVPVSQGIPGHPVIFAAEHLEALRALGDEDNYRSILLAHSEAISDSHFDETSFLRTAENPDEYRELLRLAGLPVPTPPQQVRQHY
ncbi:MAG: NTP transferase domain-containing protein [Candidatus Eisenbacteria bacterium]|uniref:NTP transferase domain-containing protein n=1 Tax=Eiseniibacteriota bacterium TaxID=2212470 RepID=A0A948S127_UNCEI|nr:NTP transferase domain-containing protein [Candidatus Eisenbacteria bacterium]MBU1947958.1 NTP transferase domain-containing protein [Candidatus Eisenbacteria bacterium]MBU2693418.1 NTP transferase domain-containing protein [Candidatus Eisenbacteria bacterium]